MAGRKKKTGEDRDGTGAVPYEKNGGRRKAGAGKGTPSTAARSPSPSGEASGAGKKPKEEAGKKAGKKTGEKAADQEKKPKAPKRAFRYPGRGAPKIYATAEALARGCEKYFASISVVEELCNPVTGEQELSSLGKPIERVVWLMQPSMGALARSLGISDRTLRNYGEDTADPDGSGNTKAAVVEWAKGICRDYLLEQVTTREKGSLNGLIFVLENNFGMKEQLSVEHSGERIEEYLARLEAGAEAAEF